MDHTDSIKKLTKNLKNKDCLIRCEAIEELSDFPEELVYDLVMNMMNDKNYLVRCEAYEALINIKTSKGVDILLAHLKKERNSAARAYGVAAIGSMLKLSNYTNDTILQLKNMFQREKSKRVVISYNALFYQIEKEERYIKDALAYLDDRDYHIRCTVINSLREVQDDSVVDLIYHEYKKRLEVEESGAVKTSLEEEIQWIENGRLSEKND